VSIGSADPRRGAPPDRLTGSAVWSLRLAGFAAVVNGAGFGAFDIPASWRLAHDHEVWYVDGNPTYGNGPFEAHGISVTVPVLVAFLGTCLVLAVGGVLLLVPRTTGVVVVLAGIILCAPFWWGFDLPFAWFSAAGVLALLAIAGGAWMLTRPGTASPDGPASPGRTTTHAPVASTQAARTSESRALRQAGWAGAASIALLALGVTLCSFAGVDAPGTSDATINERLDDGGKQAAAGIGLPLLSLGAALLLWFATGLRRLLDRLSGGDPLAHAVVPAAALVGGLVITGTSLDVSSAVTALGSDEFTPDPDLARLLGTAGLLVALTGLTGGAVLVAATTRIAQQARAMPSWAVWVSYAVAVLCLTGFWSGGTASVVLGMWLIGAVIALVRTSSWTTSASPDADAPVPPVPPVSRRC
jgi:hypothetical protein